MNITLSRAAAKTFQAMDGPTKDRIKTALSKIPKGDIKVMQGFSDGRKRLRIGKYRAVFIDVTTQDSDKGVHVIELGSRGNIYK